MAVERIDSIYDLEKIGKEHEQLSKYLVDDLGAINKLYEAIQKGGKANTMTEVVQSAKDQSAAIKELTLTNIKLQAEIKAVENLSKQRFATDAKLITQKTDYAKATAANTVEIQKNNKELKAQAAAEQAVTGSRERASAQVKLLTLQKDKLNLLNKDEAKQYDILVAKIEKYEAFLKKTGTTAEQQRANIGNYQGSAKIIVDALEKQRLKLEELEKAKIRVQNAGGTFNPGNVAATRTTITGFAGGSQNNQALNDIAKNANNAEQAVSLLEEEITKTRTVVEGFARVTDNPKFLNVAGKVGDSTSELIFFTKALIELERQGLGTSEAANELRQKLAELTDEVSGAKAEIKALSSDTRSFDLFAGSVTFAADAFQTFAGAAVLAGASEEDAAEATKTLVAVQSVANGVKGIANELTTRGTAANKAYAFAQRQVAIVTDSSATSLARFKAALITTGIGALIIGVGLLVANFGKLKEALGITNKAQEAVNETLKDYQEGTKSAIEQTNKVRSAFESAKNGVISKDEALKVYNDTLGDTLGQAKTLEEAEDNYNKKAAIYIEAMGLRAQANALFAKSAEAVAKGTTAGFEDQTSFWDKLKSGAKSYLGFTVTAANDLANAQAVGEKKVREDAKKTSEALFAEGQARAEQADKLTKSAGIDLDPEKAVKGSKVKKAADDAKKITEQRLKESLDAEKRNADASKNIAIEKANEAIRINKLIVDDEKSSLMQKIDATTEIINQQKKLALIEYTQQIADEKTIQDGKVKIVQKSAKEKEAAEIAYTNKLKALNQQRSAEVDRIYSDDFKKIQENNKKTKEEFDKAAEEAKKRANDQIDLSANNEILAANAEYALKLKGATDEKRLELEQELADKILEINRKTELEKSELIEADLQNKRKILVLFGVTTVSIDKLITEEQIKQDNLRKASDDALYAGKKKNKEKELALEKQIKAAKEQLGKELYNLTITLLDAGNEKKLNALAKEKEQDDKTYEQEINNITNSTLSEEEKANRLQIISKEKEARDSENDRKRREVQIKQAKFDKLKAISEIIFGTSIAVVNALGAKPWTPANIALASIVGAIGAVQIAAAAARPIPQYAEGTSDHPGGLAIIGERKDNIPERVDFPDGTSFITDGPMLANLPKHTSVTPLTEAEMMGAVRANNMRTMSDDIHLFKTMWARENRELSELPKKIDSLTSAVYSTSARQISAYKKNRPIVILDNQKSDFYNGLKSKI